MKRIISITLAFVIIMSFSSFATTEGENMTEYKNVVEAEISGYAHDSHGNIDGFGYNVPFKIYYNDSYKTSAGGAITIDEFVVNDGIPVLKVTVNTDRPDIADYKTTIRCHISEDVYTDIESAGVSSLVSAGTYQMNDELLAGLEASKFFKKHTVQSIEVWIDEYDYSQK